MKSKFKIGDKVKDNFGNVGIITDIYMRDDSLTQIIVNYYNGSPNYTEYEFEIEGIDE